MWEKFEKLRLERGVSAYQVCRAIGEQTAMISNWKAGRYTPKPDKIKKIADYFGVPISYFYGDEEPHYYYDEETREMAEMLRTDKNYRILFDAARGSKPEDLQMAADLLNRFKETNKE